MDSNRDAIRQNANTLPFVIGVKDGYSEDESSNNTNCNNNDDDDDDDDESSTTTEPCPHISRAPIFIPSPQVPDDIILPNIPSHVSITDSDTTHSVSAINFDQSSLETTSHISSFNIDSGFSLSKIKNKSEEEIDEEDSSSSFSISLKKQISKQDNIKPKKSSPKKSHAKVQNPRHQASKESNNSKVSFSKESNQKQSNQNNKQAKPPSSKSQSGQNSSSPPTVVNLPSKDKKLPKVFSFSDESVEISTTSDTMTCQSGSFSDYSTSTSASTTKQTIIEDDSANETIKTYVDDDNSKNAQRATPVEPPTICCMLL